MRRENLQRRQGGALTARASGLTPFSIIETQMDSDRLSSWQFCAVACQFTSQSGSDIWNEIDR